MECPTFYMAIPNKMITFANPIPIDYILTYIWTKIQQTQTCL